MDRVVIVSARIGAGHDGAARELDRRFAARGAEVVRADFLDLLPGRLGALLCETYHRQLKTVPRSWDWLLGALGTPTLAGASRRFAGLATPALREVLGDSTDLVVSTYPLGTHAAARLARTERGCAPLVTYLTDPSVHRLCVSPMAKLTVAPNEIAARQARSLGAGRVLVSSPLVSPAFRPGAGPASRLLLRRRLGLPRDRALALVVAGSWGVGQIGQTAADLVGTGLVEPVVVCGRNEVLARRLHQAGHRYVFGWVDEMADLMRACDVVVQNAGGLTTSEALATGLPVLTYRCLPGHGRANAAVLHDDGTVPWVRSPRELAGALDWVLRPVEAAG
ncbi:UDP-N-acetylglucosamine:LPS N-acetylglucosamine transferase [Amycolatopsis sulphurea]|uniref:UDP-N-acetylglucosamine:LPS N-acetylglucosamine transferase n=1 Tax=Amycolatopsis sulphurea TaxID=76022 RepID=A0A2A9FD38_9PSEU|nr:glycosyltransferase [Amycolatopsis sulphurea]PFG49357.1 UDP-N-acetylglucosamine:LPS N-acetylglucosamine transferase [Amycolatopsis sulphurea]